jgi:hypothetical protein
MPVTLITPEGKAVIVPDDEVMAKKRLGYTEESTRQAAARSADDQIKEDSSTVAAKGQALLAGVGRGATFGLTDVAMGATGDEDITRRLRNVREANPTLSTAGEIAGGVGVALATGGGSAAASGGGTARYVAGSALRGSIEGGAQAGGMYLSDAALYNKEASAEGFLAATGTGVALGGAAGGAFAGAERGFIKARDLIPKSSASKESVIRAADDVDAEVTRALATGDDSIRTAKDQLELMRLQRAELDVAAQQRVLEKRAAEAAKAQAAADLQAQKLATQQQLDEVRIAKAKEPKTSRPGRGGKTRSPVEQTPDILPPQAPTYESIAKGDVIDAEIPADALANRIELPGGTDDAVKAQKAQDIVGREPLRTDVPDPIRLAVHPDGRYEVVDGRNRIAAAIEQGKPIRAKVERAYVPDDVVGKPIGNVRPGGSEFGAPADGAGSRYGNAPAGMEDDSLEDLLRKSVEQGKPQTSLDEIHEAMAELDPDAARLVDAVRAQEAAAANLQKRFRVRAPQEIGGSTSAVIPDAPNLTLGRVKQMYEVANDAEKAALLQQVGPEKAKALLEIVEGKAGFAKWYKNKNHWWDDPTYRPLPERVGPAADDLGNLAPRVMPGAEGAIAGADDMARLADDELASLDDMHRAVAELSEYERSVTDLATALGPNAPPSAMEMAAKYTMAVDDNARKVADRMAQVADEAPVPSAFPEGSGPVRMPEMPATPPVAAAPSPTPMADTLRAGMAKDADAAKAAGLVSLPGAGGLAAPAKKKGIAGMLADLGSANEALQAVGVNLPFMPDVDKIPVIGPLVGGYLKLRAGLTVLGKAGFRVPLSGEARVAAGAAKTRDRVAQSVDRLLGVGVKAARAARPVVASQAWRVPDALSSVLYDTGEKHPRAKSKDPTEMLAMRTREVLAAQSNPAGVKATVRAAMRDVRDPDVINAVYAVAQRKFDYLAKHAPVAPPQNPLSKSKWQASPAEIERFARRVRAANDPVSVLDDVATGRVTPEGAETLREVYPQLYSEARVRLIEQAPKLSRSLPHRTIVRLSVLFDAPLVSSLEPDNLAAIQAAGKPSNDNGQGGAPMAAPPGAPAMSPPPAGAPDLSSMYMTPGQKRAVR